MSPIIQPYAPYTWITPSAAMGGVRAYGEPLHEFHETVNCAKELHPYAEKRTSFALDDVEVLDPPQLEQMNRAAHHVYCRLVDGQKVLVTCFAGRNRSGVVLAEALIRLGHHPRKVVDTIQAKRDKALTNRAFVAWLLRDR